MSTISLTDQLSHEPFPELARALHTRIGAILKAWREVTVPVLPHIDEHTIVDFENDIAAILGALADSLARDDASRVHEVLYHAPKHGLHRFVQRYPLDDLLTENRLLRKVILEQVEQELGRLLTSLESVSLHAAIDVIFQAGTQAMVASMNAKLRETAESELRFISFLSHDLESNLVAARLHLKAAATAATSEADGSLKKTLHTLERIAGDMKRLLKQEQLRRSAAVPLRHPSPLCAEVERIVEPLATEAHGAGARLEVDIDPDIEVDADPEMLRLVLKNLIDNALKHAGGSAVLVTGVRDADGRRRISIADEGPGIGPETLARIKAAFERGEALGSPGVGLGLAIASQAAKLLEAQVLVETQRGVGATVHVLLPQRRQEMAPVSVARS